MALDDPYATPDDFRTYNKMQIECADAELLDVLNAASREIEKHCDRVFNKVGAATTRTFEPQDPWEIEVDDFYSTTGLLVELDLGYSGAYETVLAPPNYRLYPLNGIVDGQPGWPFSSIRSVGTGIWFPVRRGGWWPADTVRVTALWGWAAVPAPIKRACLLLTAQIWKMQEAPFGIAGFDQFGSVRVRDIPMIAKLLCPYERNPIKVA